MDFFLIGDVLDTGDRRGAGFRLAVRDREAKSFGIGSSQQAVGLGA
tara:strand:- start:409 stop:546 length:138 start_codon:yes stop_codon:yes gene_type:complete